MKPVRYTSRDFDHFVRVLIDRWEDAVERRAEWPTLDGEERALYSEDWPVNNDIHQHLADYAGEHGLAEEQQEQWARLQALVTQYADALREMGYRVRIPKVGKTKAVA